MGDEEQHCTKATECTGSVGPGACQPVLDHLARSPDISHQCRATCDDATDVSDGRPHGVPPAQK